MAALNFPNGPSLGDKYPTPAVVGQPQYTWDGEKWTTVGTQISNATPSAAVPLMDATPGLAGTAAAYSRGDHVHPTDTTRAALAYVDGNLVAYNAAQTTTPAQRSQARANVAVTKKNYILNGGMQVSQENGATAGTTFPYWPVDMFVAAGTHSAVLSAAQVASVTPGGSTSRLRITVTTADTSIAAGEAMSINTAMEGLRAADLLFGTASAKTVTLQFGVKAPAGTYSVALKNDAGNRTYIAEYVIAAGEANTDVVRSITIPGDVTGTWFVNNARWGIAGWGLAAGTTYQQAAGSWGTGNAIGSPNQFNFLGTAGNVFELFDVSLTEGTIAPPFQLPDYVSELALCQRYFECWDALASGWSNACAGSASSNATQEGVFVYKVAKRTAPTLSVNAVANFSVSYNGGANVSTCTVMTAIYSTIYSLNLRATATGTPLTLGMATMVCATNPQNARMFINARL